MIFLPSRSITNWKELINKVVVGDCIELMKLIPDKAIDLVITDPPYGTGNRMTYRKNNYGKLTKTKDYGNFQWNSKIPSRKVFEQILRVSKNQIIWGGNYFVEYLRNSPCWIVWDKDNIKSSFADCEIAWTSFSSGIRKIRFRWNGMLQENMKQKDFRFHPTQKPLELIRWLITHYAKKGDLILDPFMGSWTTARAAKDMGYDFIGCDYIESYCISGQNRLRQETLF